MTEKPYKLYGMMASLYTAKVRAYMRYHGVNFIDFAAGNPEFSEKIVPLVNRWIVPVIETPDGQIIQDGTVILDYLNEEVPNKGSIHPDTPVMQAIAHLFELFGGEGLLRPAMHYRWNFDDDNLDFLKLVFRDVLPPNMPDDQYEGFFLHASGRMRKATQFFGVRDNFADVEASYDEFLSLVDAHLSKHPFLLGGRPTIADYGLFGPLFAHLGRDPKPLGLMLKKAPNLFQWLERMQSPAIIENEIYNASKGELFKDDDIPETLVNLMNYVAEEYLPEITAHVDQANDWLANNPDIKSGTSGLKGLTDRTIGFAEFALRGKKHSSSVMIYRFFLLQRLTDHFAEASDNDKTAITNAFAAAGLESMLTIGTNRRVIRKDYLEVWE